MVMEQTLPAKWEGKVSTRLTRASADQIWPLFTDFFNIGRYFTGLATSYGVHGDNGEPGCIRYCAGFSVPSRSSSVGWSRERLVAVDHVRRRLTYEMADSNIGFNSYVSTVEISTANDADDGSGCVIEWCFAVDPVEGLAFDELVQKYDSGLRRMAAVMEDTILQA